MTDIFSHPHLDAEALRAALANREVYLVGGSVRDYILGEPLHDFDFALPTRAIKTAFHVGDALGLPAFVLDKQRDIGRVMLADGETTLDFARYRAADGSFGETLEADLRGRDFTLNAIALPIAPGNDQYIDPTGGVADIEAKVVRMTHAQAVDQDPARALRGLRMALKFGFTIEEKTRTAIADMQGQLWRISAERVRDEFMKLLMLDGGLVALREHHLLADIAPEIAALAEAGLLAETVRVLADSDQAHGERVAAHLARRYDGGYSGRELLRLGAALHAVGKGKTRAVQEDGSLTYPDYANVGAMLADTRLKQLKFSNAATDRVRLMVKAHRRPAELAASEHLTDRAIFRYFNTLGDVGVEIALLSLAVDDAAHLGETVQTLLDYFFERKDVVRPQPLIGGRELIEMGLRPGPDFGRILAAVTEAQAAGEITTHAQALEMARAIATGVDPAASP